MKDMYNLECRYDSRDSFYGKAKVNVINENNSELYSYGTLVARIKDGVAEILGQFSQTTTRHQKEYLKQNNFRVDDTKQMIKDYYKGEV